MIFIATYILLVKPSYPSEVRHYLFNVSSIHLFIEIDSAIPFTLVSLDRLDVLMDIDKSLLLSKLVKSLDQKVELMRKRSLFLRLLEDFWNLVLDH